MSGQVTVRLASLDDAKTVRALRLDALRTVPEFYGGRYEDARRLRLGRWEAQLLHAEEEGRWCFLAFCGSEPIGVGWVTLTPGDERGPCELQGLWVADGHRGSGVGRALNDARESWARSQQLPSMHVTCAGSNLKARGLMESCGYRILQVEPWPGHEPETLVHMAKEL